MPNPVPITGVKGERSIFIGQIEDRYLPVLGEMRAVAPEPHVMEKSGFISRRRRRVSWAGKHNTRSRLLVNRREPFGGQGAN